MIFPIYTDTPVRRTPAVNYALIAVNALIHVATAAAEPGSFLYDWREWGILRARDPELYQFFTYQFLHGGWAHLVGNMLFLWVFGNAVNAKMGNLPYLLFYLAGGVFAAAGYALFNPYDMLGASGAIAAITTAYLALYPRSYITIVYWFFFIGTFEVPSMYLIVFKMILWDNVFAARLAGESNVAFGAHLAGYGFGFVTAALLLALRCLPRDQFDIVALWRRWLQRRGMQTMMADPDTRNRAQFGRVARPISIDDVNLHGPGSPQFDQITDLRLRISEALARNDRAAAAGLYERVLELDPRQVLSQTQQLDVANQLYTMGRFPQAAAAYEKYLSAYGNSPDADQVRLLLGIIYARDLHQYEVAEGHLRPLADRLTDERRREQCRHWLQVAVEALGRPAAEA